MFKCGAKDHNDGDKPSSFSVSLPLSALTSYFTLIQLWQFKRF